MKKFALKSVFQNLSIAAVLLSTSFHIFAANYGGNSNNNMEPEVLAKISRSAVDKALSPDGLKAVFGLYFGPHKFENSVNSKEEKCSMKTQKKMSVFGGVLGVEYGKSFRNSMFLAANILLDVGPKKKQSGDWKTINEAFDNSISKETSPGERKAQLSTEFFTPSVGVKLGYRLRTLRSVIYVKLALSRLAGRCTYYLGDKKFEDSKMNTMVISGGLGGEYRFNKKLGVGFEIGAPFQRKTNKKKLNGVEQITKMSRVEARALFYYTLTDNLDSSAASNFLKQ